MLTGTKVPLMYRDAMLADRTAQRTVDDKNHVPRSTFTKKGPGVPLDRDDALDHYNCELRARTITVPAPVDTTPPVVSKPKWSLLNTLRNTVRRLTPGGRVRSR